MGGVQSTQPSEEPCPLLEEPWRKVNWSKQDLLNMVKEFKPSTDEVNHVRILLYGPVGAGKSSYVNSVSTAILGRSAIPSSVNTPTDAARSFTVTYKTYKIKKATKEYYPFVFNDIMGLESGADVGVLTEDIKLAMMGHVRDGYTFNSRSLLKTDNTQYYNKSPSANDKVHLLVCVLNANCPEIKPSIIEKMKKIREEARDLGIPQIAIATHIDLLCEEVEKDVKNVYRSKYLQRKMSEFSATVGIPMYSIFPLKNYCSEVDSNDDVDTLILTSLKHMLTYADDFVNTFEDA